MAYTVLSEQMSAVKHSFQNKFLVFVKRLVALVQVEDSSDLSDLELIQHMNMDLSRLTKLLNGE